MGANRIYLSVEPASGTDPEALESRLTAGETFDAWHKRYNETIVVAGVGAEDPAFQRLRAVGDRVHRAFLLYVVDTAGDGVGWVYERMGLRSLMGTFLSREDAPISEHGAPARLGSLSLREEIEGGVRRGIDVVDYVKREYNIDGPR